MSSQVTRFHQYLMDGQDESKFCDGSTHFMLMEPWVLDEAHKLLRRGVCDGSCQPEVCMKDIRPFIAKHDKTLQTVQKGLLPSVTEVAPELSALFAGDAPVVGLHFASSYQKRFGVSDTFCVEGVGHVCVSTQNDWFLDGPDVDRCQTVSVELEPCDGHCESNVFDRDAYLADPWGCEFGEE